MLRLPAEPLDERGGWSLPAWLRPLVGMAALLILLVAASPVAAESAPFCRAGQAPAFEHGLRWLQLVTGEVMGAPAECVHYDGQTGDALQRTTTGLAYWRKSTNTPVFTDGWRHWAWTSNGLAQWVGGFVDQPGAAAVVDLSLHSDAWDLGWNELYAPTPEVVFSDAGIVITVAAPAADQDYPRVAVWSREASPVSGGQAFVMEVEARIESEDSQGNFLIGTNMQPSGHVFMHWHLNADQFGRYYGDWSETHRRAPPANEPECTISDTTVDDRWHTFRLEWDGQDVMRYMPDGVLVCEQIRSTQYRLALGEALTFHAYLERYPGGSPRPYQMGIRRFAAWVGD